MTDRDERELERRAALDAESRAELVAARARRDAGGGLAVFCGIHSNLEALTAVLEEIDCSRIDDVLCLGDIVSFGPDPEACIDLLRERGVPCLRGLLDQIVLSGSGQAFPFIPGYRLKWAGERLRPRLLGRREALARREWLEALPERCEREWGFAFTDFAGGGRNWLPSSVDLSCPGGYLGPPRFFEGKPLLTISGGGYRPPTALRRSDFHDGYDFYEGSGLETIARDGRQLGIHPGTVGCPFDDDPRASYAIVREDRIEWRRVEYDVERTCARLVQTGLASDHPLVTRLRAGC